MGRSLLLKGLVVRPISGAGAGRLIAFDTARRLGLGDAATGLEFHRVRGQDGAQGVPGLVVDYV